MSIATENHMESKRIEWIDMAKGYGILCVFVGHMVQSSALGLFVYSFHLPLFFFLSGFLFNPGDNFFAFLKKKCRGILLPYFTLGLLVVFCDAYYPLLFSGRHFSTRHLIYEISKEFQAYIIQCRYATLWYLATLFGVNILMFFICKIKKDAVRIAVVIALFLAAMIYYHQGGGELPWNVDVICPALLFFATGYAAKKKDLIQSSPLFTKGFFAMLLLLLAVNISFNILTLAMSGDGLEMYRCSYGIFPITLISAFAGIFFVILLSTKTSFRCINYIGKNSLIFFMWHQAVIYPVLDAVYYGLGIKGYGSNPVEFLAIVFSRLIITCLIMSLFTELLRRTPLRIVIK